MVLICEIRSSASQGLPPAQPQAEAEAAEEADGAGEGRVEERAVLVGDPEAVEVGAGLAELVAEDVDLDAGLGEGLLLDALGGLRRGRRRSGRHRDHRRPPGQKAAARARPRAPVRTSFSSRATGFMATVRAPSTEVIVPRQRAPG